MEKLVIGIDWGFENQEESPCEMCGGSEEVHTPAENRGGEIVGPDTRPCPACRIKNEDEYDQNDDR